MDAETSKMLEVFLALDSPANYACLEDAQESISDEFEVDSETHNEICERVEEWWLIGE